MGANRMIVENVINLGGEGKKKQCCVLRKCQALASSTYPLPSLNHTRSWF